MKSLLSRRIPTIIGIVLIVAGLAAGVWYFYLNRPVVSEGEKPQKVRITNAADNKFTVSWVTKEAVAGELEWGAVGEKLTQKASDDRDRAGEGQAYLTHHVTVSELQPETQYAFRILSGERRVRFDNNGSPYTAKTGPTIRGTPVAESFYGQVETETGQPAGGAIVYVTLPGSAPVSALTKSSGSYSVSLTTMRTDSLDEYIVYDPAASVVAVTVTDGKKESTASVATGNAAPVPTIVMGQTHDFRNQAPGTVAEVGTLPAEGGEEAQGVIQEVPTVFNVEPLGDLPDPSEQVILLNPAEEGEEVATARPEFFGLGPVDTVISITVHSVLPQSDTVIVDEYGEWYWSPPSNLEPGEHTVTIAYIDLAGIEQVVSRTFFVQPALAQGTAFEATPSGTTATPTPTPTATATPAGFPSPSSSSLYEVSPTPTPTASTMPSPREGIPSTESGVPVSGIAAPTVLTVLLGFAIMVVGALLIAL